MKSPQLCFAFLKILLPFSLSLFCILLSCLFTVLGFLHQSRWADIYAERERGGLGNPFWVQLFNERLVRSLIVFSQTVYVERRQRTYRLALIFHTLFA
jgi:hypothetical protein